MALAPTSSGVGPVIAEVEMNAGADQGATTMRATVVQACSVFYDTPATLDKAEKLTAEAAGYGSQLVLFPEVFVSGYPHGSAFGLTVGSRSAKGKEDFWKYHASAIDVPASDQEAARLSSRVHVADEEQDHHKDSEPGSTHPQPLTAPPLKARRSELEIQT